MPTEQHVDVCVCTFQRASITPCLQSLAEQVLPQGLTMRIIVIDNDDVPSARQAVEAFAADCPRPVLYRQVPGRNISIARNACLEAAEGPFIAFIDDDEEAEPTWLSNLVSSIEDADVAFGPVVARYPACAPEWLRRGDFLSAPRHRDGHLGKNGYCGNVLIRRNLLLEAEARFSEKYGRTGGEDTHFFALLDGFGARYAFADLAVVHETVPPNRTKLGYLIRRVARSGHTYCAVHDLRTVPYALASCAKAAYCLSCSAFCILDAAAWRGWLVRAAFHIGVIREIVGFRAPELYAPAARL